MINNGNNYACKLVAHCSGKTLYLFENYENKKSVGCK